MSDKTKKYILISAIILTVIFVISFLVFDRYLVNKQKVIEQQEKEALAEENREVLKDDVLIVLEKGDKEERVVSFKDLKNELKLSGNVSEEKLTKVLSKEGYELKDISASQLTYNRSIEAAIEPNKYFILEKDGYLAIYKSDDNGKLSIESEEDIYKDKKSFNQLPEVDRSTIKNYDLKFDNKEDAEEKISELIS